MPDDFNEVYFKDKLVLYKTNNTRKLEKLFSTLKYSPIELFEW